MTFREVELNREIESYLIDLVLSEGSKQSRDGVVSGSKKAAYW